MTGRTVGFVDEPAVRDETVGTVIRRSVLGQRRRPEEGKDERKENSRPADETCGPLHQTVLSSAVAVTLVPSFWPSAHRRADPPG
jgi:hypothetical protein